MEEITFIRLLELIALATASFLGFHFIRSQDKSQKYLGAFLLLGFLFDFLFILTNHLSIEIKFDFLPNTVFLYVPFLYFYALSLTAQTDKKMWRLLFPALFFYLGKFPALYFDLELFFLIETLSTYLFSVYIAFLVLKVVHTHQKNILQYFSSVEDKNLNWLRILTLILIGFNLFWLVEDGIYIFTDWEPYLPEVSAIATIITIYWIGFSSLKQNIIFKEEIPLMENNNQKTLNPSELLLFKQLSQLMETEQLYKRNNLSLREIAEHLQCSDKLLSKIINIKTHNNFYHFINTYRVNCFKNCLRQSHQTNLTLFGLAQNCGFKTKSTFYTAFKKVEGCTPKEFAQQIQSE